MSFASLELKNWYHAAVAIGLLAAVGGATFDLKNVDGKDAVIFGVGLMAIGFGEWMNHPFQTRFVQTPVGVGTASGHSRKNCFTGVLLLILGLVLVGIAGWRYAISL